LGFFDAQIHFGTEPFTMAQFQPPPPPPSPERVAFTVVGILLACVALVIFTVYLSRTSGS
jgi:hypothetical protein